MPSYADVHDCILPVRHAGTKNFNGVLVYLGKIKKSEIKILNVKFARINFKFRF